MISLNGTQNFERAFGVHGCSASALMIGILRHLQMHLVLQHLIAWPCGCRWSLVTATDQYVMTCMRNGYEYYSLFSYKIVFETKKLTIMRKKLHIVLRRLRCMQVLAKSCVQAWAFYEKNDHKDHPEMHLTYVEHVVFKATHEWHMLSESPIVELGLFKWKLCCHTSSASTLLQFGPHWAPTECVLL